MIPVINQFKKAQDRELVCRNCRKKWYQCFDRILWPVRELYGVHLCQCGACEPIDIEHRLELANHTLTWMKREIGRKQRMLHETLLEVQAMKASQVNVVEFESKVPDHE